MKRRALLACGGTLALSGCLSELTGTKIRIGWIRLVNDRDEPYHVDVVVERNDEEVFAEDYQLGTGPESSTVRIDTPVDERAQYVIRFRTDEQWVHIYPREYDDVTENCLGVQFELHRQGTRGYEIHAGTGC